jgi:hypothetical protein
MSRKKETPRETYERVFGPLTAQVSFEEYLVTHNENEEWRRLTELPKDPPPGWVEPSITLAEADADMEGSFAAQLMRDNGVERLTRTQYIWATCGYIRPSAWGAEYESTLPLKLQDWEYMWIAPSIRPPKKKRRKPKKPTDS